MGSGGMRIGGYSFNDLSPSLYMMVLFVFGALLLPFFVYSRSGFEWNGVGIVAV